MEFWSYYRIFRRRRWVVVAAVVAALAAGAFVNRPGPGRYEATATMSVPSEERAYLIGVSDQAGPDTRIAMAFNVLRSRDLAERVIQRYGLAMRPEDLQRRLRIERDRGNGLIRVTVTGTTAAEAVALTNEVVETAASYDQELQSRDSTLAREFVQKQVDTAGVKLRAAQDALLRFKQQHATLLASPASQQLASLQAQAQEIGLALDETTARLDAIRTQMQGQSATRTDQEIAANPIANQLQSQLVNYEVALTSDLAVHTEDYPSVVALERKIQAVKDRLHEELAKVVTSEHVQFNPIYDSLAQARINLETDRLALLAKRQAVAQAVGGILQQLPGLDRIDLEQARFAGNVDVLDKEYRDLQGRLAQTRLKEQEALDLGSLAVVDHATFATHASPWRALGNALLAGLLGLAAGGGIVYVLEYLDNGLRTPENAERLLGIPVLAAIPRHNPPFEEAYRLIQVGLAAQPGRGGPQVLAVTSPRPRAGTSTVVANLARAFAHVGRRTLVVDAGLHRPVLHQAFTVPNAAGLTELLAAGGALPDDATVQATGDPNLWLLPAGTVPVPLNGLLSSPAFDRVLAELKRKFEVILIDTPPAGAFADTLRIASLATGTLLVLDARQTPRGVEERVKARLHLVGATLRGAILTNVRPDLVDSYVYLERFYRAPARRPLAAAMATAVIVCFLASATVGGWQRSAALGGTIQRYAAEAAGAGHAVQQYLTGAGDAIRQRVSGVADITDAVRRMIMAQAR